MRRASGSATATTCAATPSKRSVTAKPDPLSDLRQSWDENADAWTEAVREGRIESRRLVTDAAILEAVLRLEVRRVLDLGCGEGWLCPALSQRGLEVVGVDASAALIEAAKALGGADYRVLSYEDLTAHPDSVSGPFEAVVCNFALFHEDLEPLLSALRCLLAPGGALLIQTVHPWAASGDAPYKIIRVAGAPKPSRASGLALGRCRGTTGRLAAGWRNSLKQAFWCGSLRSQFIPTPKNPCRC